jgi:uncharacterized protein
MLINILSVLNGIKDSLMIDEMVSIEEFSHMMGEFTVQEPVHVTGVVKNSFNSISLHLTVSACIDTNCGRCFQDIQVPVLFEVDSLVIKEHEEIDPDKDAILLKGNELDLSEIIWDNLLLHMDMVYLCNPDCKGLCPKCGQNLNIGNCGCDHSVVDDRLQILKKLL